MTSAAANTAAFDRGDLVPAIADFVRGFSLEATRPSADDVAALADIAEAGTRVYVSAVATRAPQEVVESAIRLHAKGFMAVPHVAVRMFASVAALDEFLNTLSGEAGVDRILVIAGDREQPAERRRHQFGVIGASREAADLGEGLPEALVVGNQGANFSVGANLMLLLLEAREGNWDEIDLVVRQFQKATMAAHQAPAILAAVASVSACRKVTLPIRRIGSDNNSPSSTASPARLM